ncbi:MAG: DUF3011 domain-containing protein [Pseudomonadota bacterium]
MRRLLASSALLIAASAAAPAVAAPQAWQGYGPDTGVVRCESNDGRVRECPTGGGRVMIERQISRSACIEGQSWGYGRNGIWVSQGCRADFRIVGRDGYYGGGGYGDPYGGNYQGGGAYAGQTIRCESNDNRVQRCAMGTRGRVELVRQISRSACVEGRTWGSDRGGVWVAQGCRGEFTSAGRGNAYGYGNGNAYGNGGHGGSYGGGRVFRCESNDGRTRECAVNTRAGVQLVRQLSKAACIQGRTWGYGGNGIWVSQGCRAEFRSY